MADTRQAAEKLREEHEVTYGAYGGTAACRSCLYPLRRKMLIPKSLKRSPGSRTSAYGGTAAYKSALPRVTAIKKTTMLPRVTAIEKTTAAKVHGGRKEHVAKGHGD